MFEAQEPESPPAPPREGTETHGREDQGLLRALARIHVTPSLANQLVAQYGTARVWQVVWYMQQPANTGLGIGWLRAELKCPTSVPTTAHTLSISAPCLIDDVGESGGAAYDCAGASSALGAFGAAPDPSLASPVNSKHTAASLWALVAESTGSQGLPRGKDLSPSRL